MAAPVLGSPPIVFVHGNGDTAALWLTTIWRFESNGYPAALLHAIDFSYPQARDDDARPQSGRSGTDEQMRELAQFVDRVLAATKAPRVAMIASSRGANSVRNFIRRGGAGLVSHALLAGGVNHGVHASTSFNPGSEFNGDGAFMRSLNAAYPDGNEVAPEVLWLTLRSDGFDKYAQPDGRFVGEPGVPTGLTFDAPALKGAVNEVLPRADHREVAFGPEAFARMFQFISGAEPASTAIAAEDPVVLDGKLSGYLSGSPTNLPLAGAQVTVHLVDTVNGERIKETLHRAVIGADGRWGPLTTTAQSALEFVIEARGYPITHIYRSPFARSSAIVHLRPALPDSPGNEDMSASSVVVISRPRGYFGIGRDTFLIDGKVPADVIEGVPSISVARMRVPAAPMRAVRTQFNGEFITVRNWPARERRIVYAEFNA